MTDFCTIFSAGEYGDRSPAKGFLIAADGGLTYMTDCGLTPDLVVGDFDSLGYVPRAENVLTHPKEKDDTDTMLAVKLALEKGAKKILIYGGLGGRIDHSFANLTTLAYLAERGALCCLSGRDQSVFALSGGKLSFPGNQEGTVSVFAFSGAARVKLSGLKYPFDGEMDPCFPLGVSNEFTGKPAEIAVSRGVALIFLKDSPENILKILEENHV